jgi:hypothetical protein
MKNHIIYDFYSLPEFAGIPREEIKEALLNCMFSSLMHWQTWLGSTISISFFKLGDFLFNSRSYTGLYSISWFAITTLPFYILGAFIGSQIIMQQTRPHLKEYLLKKEKEQKLALTESEKGLYENLSRVRANIAIPKGVLSSTICNDVTLKEMARLKPTTLSALEKISGITKEFIQNYGNFFVDEIRMYKS